MIPYHIETLYRHEPWANWLLLGLTVGVGVVIETGGIPAAAVEGSFVLGQGGAEAFVAHLFAPHGITHLLGNLVFLWLFGNAICGAVGNLAFLGLYLGLGAFAGFVHLLCGGAPVVGASGAIAGLVGLALAFYPTNRVSLCCPLPFAPRTVSLPLWGVAAYWITWDGVSAGFHLGPVAYWAHLGGIAAGVGAGLLLLSVGCVELTEHDNASLLDRVLHRPPPHKLRAAAQARAELRRMARAYMQEYAEAPAIAAPAALTPRPRLTLARSIAGARQPKAEPDRAVRFGAPRTVPLRRQPAPALEADARPTAWPPALPDVRYFYFDGRQRTGPMHRADFLAALTHAADTSRWWYWAEGMQDWRRVTDLGVAHPSPLRPSLQPSHLG